MIVKYFTQIAGIILAALSLNTSVFATSKSEADQTIETCLNMGPGVPIELAYQACIKAFDTAIGEAQKADIHSEAKRQLLWLQASKAASLSLLTKVTIDKGVNLATCNIALNGLKADNQLTDKSKESFKDLRSLSTLQPIFNHCHKNTMYPAQNK